MKWINAVWCSSCHCHYCQNSLGQRTNVKSIKMSVYLCRRSVPTPTKHIYSLLELLEESGTSGRWGDLLFCSPSYPNGPGVYTGCCWTGEWWGRCRQASPVHAVQALLLSPHSRSLALYSWWEKKGQILVTQIQGNVNSYNSNIIHKSGASNKTADSKFMPSFCKSRHSDTLLNLCAHQLNNLDTEATPTTLQTPGSLYDSVAETQSTENRIDPSGKGAGSERRRKPNWVNKRKLKCHYTSKVLWGKESNLSSDWQLLPEQIHSLLISCWNWRLSHDAAWP